MSTAAPPAAPAPAKTPQRTAFDRRLIVPMVVGAIFNPINSSIIAVSLVPIGHAFGAPVSQTVWLVSALYLATAIGQPVVGRLVDAFGPRPLYLGGSVLMALGGVLGTVAPSLGVLIAARVLLGFGTCSGYPAAMYLIRSEARRTGQDSPAAVLTTLSIATQTISVIGPSLGGLLIAIGGWRSTIAINIPLGLIGIALGLTLLPKHTRTVAEDEQQHGFDVPGIALFAAALTALLLFLMNIDVDHIYVLAIALALGAAFGVRELRVTHTDPFIDLRVLSGNGPLIATYARTILTMIISYAFLYGFTQWLEDGRGLSASAAGLILLPMFATGIVVAAVTGRRQAVRGKLVVGSLAQLVAIILLFALDGDSPLWLPVLIALILGIPQGLNNLANQNALYFQAEPERIAASAGLSRTFGYLGAIAASAATGAFFGATADTAGLHHLALFLVGVAALFLIVTLADRSLSLLTKTKS
jgi:MFS family permease